MPLTKGQRGAVRGGCVAEGRGQRAAASESGKAAREEVASVTGPKVKAGEGCEQIGGDRSSAGCGEGGGSGRMALGDGRNNGKG